MATNKLKVMLSFMREVNDGNTPNASDYGITNEELWNVIEAAQEEGLIKDARFSTGGQGGKIHMAFLDAVKLTIKGLEYLDEHSVAMKAYKGLKELRDWLPF